MEQVVHIKTLGDLVDDSQAIGDNSDMTGNSNNNTYIHTGFL